MNNKGNETPGRRTRTNNAGTVATRRSPAAKSTRAASRAKATSTQKAIRTLPRQNIKSSKQEVYNTKMMRALEENGLPNWKVKIQQEGRERLRRSIEKSRESECDRQLYRMEGWGVNLPTSAELRFIIKLMPILKPVK